MCASDKKEILNNSKIIPKEKSSAKKEKEPKRKYGTYQNVLLTDAEYSKISEDTEGGQIIDCFSALKEMKGYKYKNDYLAILKWGISAYLEEKEKYTSNTGTIAADKRTEISNLKHLAGNVMRSTRAKSNFANHDNTKHYDLF